ncbi:Uncharacterized protein TCM_032326 [Theobroma cacao]|uniref:Uncharacterized protein n=1 Tax=Theobroma cacao TaxID=3641 RepID=A0A061F9K6_THECC|nr:Uncharacterized protein TCM_032326 [Theobroma cacao]
MELLADSILQTRRLAVYGASKRNRSQGATETLKTQLAFNFLSFENIIYWLNVAIIDLLPILVSQAGWCLKLKSCLVSLFCDA